MIVDRDLPFGISVLVEHDSVSVGDVHPEWHPKRRAEWVSSRAALSHAFSLQQVSISPKDLQTEGYHQVASLPQWWFSLSHDKENSIAWLVERKAVRGAGVDVEEQARTLSEAVKNRFISKRDTARLSPLCLWSIKEAAFKALDAETQKNLAFRSIQIFENGNFAVENTLIQGLWLQKTAKNSLISYAWIPVGIP